MAMPTFTAEGPLQACFSQLKEPTEIRDPCGTLLGVYTPAGAGEAHSQPSSLAARFDREEIKRRKLAAKNDPGKPLGEIIDRLISHEKAP